MKRLKIEIQVIFLTVSIAAAVIVSGYLVYQSLSKIVDTIHKEARPDLKLLLIKEIAADLNEVENTVRLYSLTDDVTFLKPYRQLNSAVTEKLSELQNYVASDTSEIHQIDSIRILSNRKLLIWDQIRTLHRTKENAHDSFSELYSKLDTAIVQADTVTIKPEVKKGFLKRLFSKKDTAKRSIIIDKSKEKEIIKQEIAGTEKNITDQTQRLQAQDKALLEKNIQVTKILNQLITRIESSEQKRLETKTQEADSMAAKTYQRLAIFTIAAVILLLLVLFVFFRNLQQNRTYQKALKKAKAEAESLAKAKEMFVATVSHEMRTPVNAIYGLTEQMLQKASSAEMTADLEVVYKSAGHLISMVNDTLDFSRMESQMLRFEQIDFLPDELFQEVYILHKNSVQAKGLELIFDIQTEKNLVLKGDPIRLKQILINLVSNAIKFTNRGQITVSASVKENTEQAFLLNIEVSDTGVGISKADQERIFDEFVQLDTDLTQKRRGTGLGLAIVKKLIELQNGQISVGSIPGKGTRFTIQIPYQKGSPVIFRTKSNEQPDIPDYFKRLHFLIVDDEEFNLYLIKNILKKWGVSFTEAHNGQEATEIATNKSFDLILMDIRMPVMDGYEAATRILQVRPQAKIIALTATNKPEDTQKSQQIGIQSFLQKPFSEMALFNIVIQLLPAGNNQVDQTEEANNPPVLLDELESMSGGDSVFLNEMLKIFIRSSEDGLAKIQQSFQSEDWGSISEAAHKLAAPAKHMHALRLYNNLKNIEHEGESMKNVDEIKRLIDLIEKEITEINVFLRQHLAAE